MKKLLFLVFSLALLAAACNSKVSNQPTQNTKTTTTTSQKSPIDATIEALISGVESEQTVSTSSDNDVITSDSTVVNSYQGVSNAGY